MKYYSLEKILGDINENLWAKYREEKLINTTGTIAEINRQSKTLKIRSNGMKKVEGCLNLYWVDEDEEFNGIDVGDFVEVVFSVANWIEDSHNKGEVMVLKKLG